MLKKALIGTAAVALVGGLVFGRDSWSYVKTSVTSVRQAIKKEVPIEFEVQRARDLVAQVDSEIRKCLHVIAEEEVNVDDLRKEVDQQVGAHQRSKDQILTQRRDLDLKKDTYNYGGRVYTVSEVERDLADRFSRYQTVEETINSRRQVLNARERSLAAARQKLDNMLDSKEQMQVQIENLEARLKTLQASQVASTVSIDDSQIARTRQLISHLNKQIEVKQKLVDGAGNQTGLIPIELSSDEPRPNITAQIDQYFGDKSVTKKTTEATTVSKTAAL